MKCSASVVAVLGVTLVLASALGAFAQEAGEKQGQAVRTRVFDVRDLVLPVPDFVGPAFELQNTVVRDEGVAHGTSVFATEGGERQAAATPDEALADFVQLVRDTIEPGSWDEGGGHAIRGRSGMLVVTHTPDVLDRTKALVDQVRAVSRGRMVSVHVTIVRPKPEDLKAVLERRLFLATTPEQRAELRRLSGEIVAEARTLCLEGQRVYTATGRQQNFVQDMTVEKGPATKDEPARVSRDPDIGTVQDGFIVDTRPVVAPDGSVLLDLRASLAFVTGMENWPVGDTGAGAPPIPKAAIQLPHVGTLVFQGQYRLPNGALLFASGGTLFDKDPKDVCALIQVDVVEGVPARNK